ncbi:MAG: MFS transporter [Candidatus Omnitrophota bacterium]
MIKEKRLIFILLCLGSVTISFNVAAIAAAIPTISLDLNLSDIQVSKILPYYMIPYGLGALMYAPLAEKIIFRKIVGGSMAIFALSSLNCAFVNSLGQFLCSRVIMGLSGGSIIPLGLILIGRTFEKEVRGRLVGILFSSAFVSSLAGILLSGLANWRWLFLIPALLAAMITLLTFFFKFETIKIKHGRSIDYGKVIRNETVRNVFLFIFAISLFYHGIHKWLGVYLSRIYHFDQWTISFLFLLMTIGGAMGQNIGGYMADKKGRVKACYLGIMLLAAATMLLSGVFPLAVLSVILIVFSIGWTIGHNGVSTVLTDFSDEYRPEIASLNSSIRFLSGGIGFFLAGLFVEKNFQLTFLGIGLLMLTLSFFAKKVIPETLTKTN